MYKTAATGEWKYPLRVPVVCAIVCIVLAIQDVHYRMQQHAGGEYSQYGSGPVQSMILANTECQSQQYEHDSGHNEGWPGRDNIGDDRIGKPVDGRFAIFLVS